MGFAVIGAHEREIVVLAKEAQDVLREVFEPGQDFAIGEWEGFLLLKGIHVHVVTFDHHASRVGVQWCVHIVSRAHVRVARVLWGSG